MQQSRRRHSAAIEAGAALASADPARPGGNPSRKLCATVNSRPAATIDFEIPSVPGYEIIEILGRGGMGVVFKARQIALQRIVALKMLQNLERAGEKVTSPFSC